VRGEKMDKVKFKVYLEYDTEYNGYVADVPSLPGCMAQGKSEEEAMMNVQEAIKGYLKVAQKEHRIIPSEETRFVEVMV
jgi:predicted RNase H-like HicB family nuclease